ncbi:hypothetical protein AUK04_02895 [Candidatus Roizmanbacteria bacterium CG2_30_33_16]|uniref:Aspartate/glutamate/uridylate kinase domain-containing protein n=4 Tax=Candidatus Roizmaniibacteriota TaxID=1752723 RepID=A0A2H0C350_9BACT|nr:MAG: hypothetical protein AUK04_02895 [Candidatus Roizmanbacteria bacterium CG2_30_33_16]PIP64345.1 MAG: hypothetical protein COW96_03085 [Candidatus Roizmanbacteria bacterium CG22_combo_CG10-13_8_21_14_all_33_16]PIX70327.1 MAG: hypothetical protein COZ39_04645 [Candidatus Roizmanbacteria bacterium CG_4_10_14_3_um_filter_33_21]PJB87878.1 MAG: hypothetical protein CO083_04715 [Candidatus Roizmanbacteria bacterium CG_4_9_14_0_8_um_filter_34_12]
MSKNMENTYVVKIGSSVLLTRRNKLDEYRIAQIAQQIASLMEAGIGVVLVISGAVACGSNFVDLKKSDKVLRQEAAGIGQVLLTSTFNTIFKNNNLQIAQILLTKKDIESENLFEVLNNYLKAGYVPFINENDVVDLNSFSGNDFLGAEIATLLKTKEFFILSTMKGSSYGIGGGEAKQQVTYHLGKIGIKTRLLNGKVKNILLNTIL